MAHKILNLPTSSNTSVICGDFNLCFKDNRNCSFYQTLRRLGYDNVSNFPTHIAGGHIDQAWIRHASTSRDVVKDLYSPYYTIKDHDAQLLTILEKKNNSSNNLVTIDEKVLP